MKAILRTAIVLTLSISIGCEKKENKVESAKEALDFLLAEEENNVFDNTLIRAKQGSVTAMYNLGCYYSEGDHVEQDDVKAFEWWQKAADLNHTKAISNVLWAFYNEKGVKRNRVKEMKYVRLAAENGDESSYLYLANSYAYGVGLVKNPDKAFKWYRKAYDSGNKDAVIQLGYCYSDGIGVEKNSTTAIKYFEEAAFAGDSSAVTSLNLEYGWRGLKNYRKALMWDLVGGTLDGEHIDLDYYKKSYKLTQEDIDIASIDAQKILDSVNFD